MKAISRSRFYRLQARWFCFFLIIIIGLAGCSLVPISEEEAAQRTEIRATELEINVQQTLLAQQQQDRNQQQTSLAETARPAGETPPALSSPELPGLPTGTLEPDTATQALPPGNLTAQPVDEAAFQQWVNSARILLYEDMTARLETVRYVKQTLDEMGLEYKDDGSAIGWLMDDLADGPPDGSQWDLIILAAEDKSGVQADFFEDVLNAADQGTAVILEVYYLNSTYNSSASGLLNRCGLEYENNWVRIPPSRAALFASVPNHPIITSPNNILSFSTSTNQWWDPNGKITYDVGDLIKLSPGSESTLLLGTVAGIPTAHGTAAVCEGGKIILQTFSSHLLNFSVMSPLWENYIYHGLQNRFAALN